MQSLINIDRFKETTDHKRIFQNYTQKQVKLVLNLLFHVWFALGNTSEYLYMYVYIFDISDTSKILFLLNFLDVFVLLQFIWLRKILFFSNKTIARKFSLNSVKVYSLKSILKL